MQCYDFQFVIGTTMSQTACGPLWRLWDHGGGGRWFHTPCTPSLATCLINFINIHNIYTQRQTTSPLPQIVFHSGQGKAKQSLSKIVFHSGQDKAKQSPSKIVFHSGQVKPKQPPLPNCLSLRPRQSLTTSPSQIVFHSLQVKAKQPLPTKLSLTPRQS